jgi:Xaa-Pro aminopeptidase
MVGSMSISLPTHPASVYVARRARFAAALAGRAALVPSGMARPRHYAANTFPFRSDSSFHYLTGLELEGAHLLVAADGRATLFAPALAKDDAMWHGVSPSAAAMVAASGLDGVEERRKLDSGVIDENVGIIAAVDALARHEQITRWRGHWNLTAAAHAVEGVDLEVLLAMVQVRLIHDEAALADMRRAALATQAGHVAGMAATRPGRFEYEIAAAIDHEFKRRHCESAYGAIVTVHGEVLHNHNHGHEVRDGDLLLADAGAEYGNFASDVTRVWPVSGKFSATQRTMYEIVLAAETSAIAMVKPGVRYRDIHLKAAQVLTRGLVDLKILNGDVDGLVERGAHAMFFPHGVGHLIGMDVHDMENFGDHAGYAPGRQRSEQFGLGYLRLDRDLQPGMAVTIEPGFYQVPAILDSLAQPFFADKTISREALAVFADVRGIRIEDDVLCTKEGSEILSAGIPKTVAEVEAAVAG